MGSAELDKQQLIIFSHIITYGNAADRSVTENIRDEIETMWNEPKAVLKFGGTAFTVIFKITVTFQTAITDMDIH